MLSLLNEVGNKVINLKWEGRKKKVRGHLKLSLQRGDGAKWRNTGLLKLGTMC